jgi:hypothetical protein
MFEYDSDLLRTIRPLVVDVCESGAQPSGFRRLIPIIRIERTFGSGFHTLCAKPCEDRTARCYNFLTFQHFQQNALFNGV